MAGFLYYVPGGGDDVDPKQLDELGLGHVFEHPEARGCRGFPHEKGDGAIVVEGSKLGSVNHGYYPDRQEWRAIPKSRAMLGWYRDAMPVPADLERDVMLPGLDKVLGDGEHWQVPVARTIADQDEWQPVNMLPCRHTLNDDGEWVSGTPLQRYVPLFEAAQAYWDAYWEAIDKLGTQEGEGKQAQRFTVAVDDTSCVVVVQANYRVAAVELSVLGAFNDETVAVILETAADMESVATWFKKKRERDGASTAAG